MSAPPPDPASSPSIFASGASPPLIIGFIAIGAFSLGILSLCIWRRTTFRHIDTGAFRAGWRAARAARERGEEGERPVLFEVWREEVWKEGKEADGEKQREVVEKTRERGLGWADVMPLSATLSPTHIVRPPPPSSPPSPPSTSPRRLWPFRSQAPQPPTRDEEAQAAGSLEASQKTQSQTQKHLPAIEHGTLQIAVLLAMPAPRKRLPEEGQIVEYALGLVSMSWTRECDGNQVEEDDGQSKGAGRRKSEPGFVYC